jgi:hypothetical protein
MAKTLPIQTKFDLTWLNLAKIEYFQAFWLNLSKGTFNHFG